jgi:type II restriction/modification system DNA methylase subunit YeeA
LVKLKVNTTQLSKYAPEARNAFIGAVSAQAALLGITAMGNAPAEVQGDVLLIGGQAFPASNAPARRDLADRVEAHGFDQTVEAIAYTWFNRFVAIRYMELHGYLDHGYRVLSRPESAGRPEILDHADIDLPGLDREKAIELKLDGTQDEVLYRLLLLAQCNALNQSMPFLFEPVGAGDELLLPANLLHTDSLIRQLVEDIDEDLWQEIEIIGWLYQFYISEKKDQVIGKVVKSEDIPAATQLFTPNWIVKYMVQNSLGAHWLATYPQSPLKGQMEYYIEPAEQTDEVKVQLAATTPSQLSPEELTLIDPASGSGHILVEAYELFKAIYLERGYRQRDVPQLILEKNLYGLDIDERAAQLTGFALMMKGRADDRRLFERGVKLNVMALEDSEGFDAEGLAKGVELSAYRLKPGDLTELKLLFEHATTFGSLIQVPEELASSLPALKQLGEATSQDLFVSEALKRLGPLVQQAEMLAAQYDAVVANPPYMGSGNFDSTLRAGLQPRYKVTRTDLYAVFIERMLDLCGPGARLSIITMQSWMFTSSYQELRKMILETSFIQSLAQLGPRAFASIPGEIVSTVMFCTRRCLIPAGIGIYIRLTSWDSSQKPLQFQYDTNRFVFKQRDFYRVPGGPVVYWKEDLLGRLFEDNDAIGALYHFREGIHTANNERFVRSWWEIDHNRFSTAIRRQEDVDSLRVKWIPYNKGGGCFRWYGNFEFVVAFDEAARGEMGSLKGHVRPSQSLYFKEGGTWSDVGTKGFAVKYYPEGFLFDGKGPVCVGDRLELALSALNSKPFTHVAELLMPTVSYKCGTVKGIPIATPKSADQAAGVARDLISLTREDYNQREVSWDYLENAIVNRTGATIRDAVEQKLDIDEDVVSRLLELEETNNRTWIDAYGLDGELDATPTRADLNLFANLEWRYQHTLKKRLLPDERRRLFVEDQVYELVSYAIGCMMGRYSPEAPGLIYAHSGNEGFDPSRYPTFPADNDGIVPLTDTEWFDDDAAHRLIEFISVAWDKIHLEANLTFLADNLSPKKNESSRETLRRYLCDSFFKDHLQTYKKRPIYWLFSSGKQKAFQGLVYLHRYNEGTLSRMRSEYVIPLQGKMAARLETLQQDIGAATSTAHQRRLEKESASLTSQQTELLAFDEKLRHYADMRIALDLDDGVKVNYGKFGDLLAEVKAIHGTKAETA